MTQKFKSINDLKSLSDEISKSIEGITQFTLGIKNLGTGKEVSKFIMNDPILSRLFPSFSWHSHGLPETSGNYLCKLESPNRFDYIVLNYDKESNKWRFNSQFELITESVEIYRSAILMWKEIE